jgi:carbon-monoxide dehydrogenase medium subunit
MNRVSAFPEVSRTYPVLKEAVDSVASYQLRTRATIVGNICNASPAGDSIGACLLLDGVLDVHGLDGTRLVPLKDFFTGPGETVLIAGDIVTSIHFPIPPGGMAGKYIKLGRNIASDLSIVGVTIVGYSDHDAPSGYCMKLALASVAPVPLVVKNVQVFLSENSISEEALRHASRLAMEACTPIDDVRASARYRKMMVRNLSYKALKEVWEEIKGSGG